MELSNAIGKARDTGLGGSAAYGEAIEALLLLLAPAAPHIAEELWSRRGKPYSIHLQAWPTFDAALATADTLELPVQVDGKLRDRLVVTVDTPAEEIERLALASERVQAYLNGRPPRRVVQIPGRLVNIVTSGDPAG
jgi:leucyl-tRNA synthetase